MTRRGSTAVEFALTLPVLLILVAGVIDLGQYMFLVDSVAAAVAEGARTGALANPFLGEDPVAIATATADQWWIAANLPDVMTTSAQLQGLGAPNERLIVTGTVPFRSSFRMLEIPVSASSTQTIRLFHQP